MQGGELNVGSVVRETGRSRVNISKHLQLLARAGLVARRKDGLRVFYRLDDPAVEKICRLACDSIPEGMRRQREQGRGEKR
jgi:ArsR family transcriptional regulator